MTLPDSIRALAELTPIEDVLLPILRDGLPDVPVGSLIADDQQFPFVLVRRTPEFGAWTGDPRFTDSARVSVHCFCQDPNGDEDAAILSEAVRVVLRDAGMNHTVVSGKGSIISIDMAAAPRRATDWATATGPVQYADLPTGVWRYETQYDLLVRRPRRSTTTPSP